MFGLGMPEILLILVVALIFIGPKKLPDIAKSLGKAINEFKKATNDFKDSITIPDPPQPNHVKPIDIPPVNVAEPVSIEKKPYAPTTEEPLEPVYGDADKTKTHE